MVWLWHRTAATTRIQPLACEPPCAAGVALKSQKTKQNNNNNQTDLIRFQWKEEEKLNKMTTAQFDIQKGLLEVIQAILLFTDYSLI